MWHSGRAQEKKQTQKILLNFTATAAERVAAAQGGAC